jgi:hypothetical protein
VRNKKFHPANEKDLFEFLQIALDAIRELAADVDDLDSAIGQVEESMDKSVRKVYEDLDEAGYEGMEPELYDDYKIYGDEHSDDEEPVRLHTIDDILIELRGR